MSREKSKKPDRLRFLHTADWQLGKPFAGITDPLKRSRVQQERFNAVRRIKKVVADFEPEFLVVCGDLFDSPTATNATIVAALDGIAALEIPVYVIPGNHDYGGGGSIWDRPFFKSEAKRLANNLSVLRLREPVELERAVLLPCPMGRRHEIEDPTLWLRQLDYSTLPDKPRIVLAHGSVEDFGKSPGAMADALAIRSESEPELIEGFAPNIINIERLPTDELDYIALGDWHGGLQVTEKAWYCGTPEPDRFPKSGQLTGRLIAATVSRAEPRPTVEWVETGRLQWHSGEISVSDASGAASVDRWLSAVTEPQGFDTALARVVLRGSLTLDGRRELDQVKESWAARLLRFDVDEKISITPSEAEIQSLAERDEDPILSGVAGELISRLAGTELSPAEVSPEARIVLEEALAVLHAAVCSGEQI